MHYIIKLIILLILASVGFISYLFITDKLRWEDILKLLEDSFISGYKESSPPESSPPESSPPESSPPESKRHKFVEGNLNWKFTSDLKDIDCWRNWDYYQSDGTTLIKPNISISTNLNKVDTWCATTGSTFPTDRIPPDKRSPVVDLLDKSKTTILGIGGSVIIDVALEKAAKEAAEKAEKEAAEKAAKEAAEKAEKEAAEKAAKEAAEKAEKEAAEKATKEAAEKAEKEAAEKAAREAAEEASEKATREAIENSINEAAQKAIKDNADKAAKEAFEKTIAGSSDILATEATQRILKEGTDKAIAETTERLIREATEKAAREGISQVTLELTIKVIRGTALRSSIESIPILLKNATTTIAKKSIKEASDKLIKDSVLRLSKQNLVPKLSFKLQSKSLLSISKTLGKDSASIIKLTSALTKLGKISGKISSKLGIKTSTKLFSIAKALKPGPFAMFDIVNFALDVADVGGYGKMKTKSELYKTKSELEKERKIKMFNDIKKALEAVDIPFTLNDFVWPVVVDPLEDSFDDIVLSVKIMEKFNKIMLTADTATPDPIIVPYLNAINDDIKNGKILASGVTDEQIDKYVNLIDMDSIIKQINIESCQEVGGLVYDGDKCTLTEEKCNNNYNWPITDNDIYTEFKDGKCIQADPQMRQICDDMKLTYNKNTGICDISRDYCTRMGATYTYDDKIKEDDCHIPLGQEVLEVMFGTTFTRSLLRAGDATLRELSKPISEIYNDTMYATLDVISGANYKEIYVPNEINIRDKCLDVKQGKYPKLQIWDCNGTQNQKFLYDDESFKIMFTGNIENNPNNYTYCLEAPYKNDGTQLYLNKCSENPTQKFQHFNSQLYHAENTCIDLINDNNTNGNNFQLMGCRGNNAQKFNIKKKRVKNEVEPPRYKINYKGFV